MMYAIINTPYIKILKKTNYIQGERSLPRRNQNLGRARRFDSIHACKVKISNKYLKQPTAYGTGQGVLYGVQASTPCFLHLHMHPR